MYRLTEVKLSTTKYLQRCIKEFVNVCFASVKQDGIDMRIQFMTNKLLYMFLYLRSKLLIAADQQFQKLTNEPV